MKEQRNNWRVWWVGGHSLQVLCSSRNTRQQGECWGHSSPSTELSPVPSHHPALPVWCPRPVSSCSTACLQPGAVSLSGVGWEQEGQRGPHPAPVLLCLWWAVFMRSYLVSIPRNLKTFHGNFCAQLLPGWAGQAQPE